MAGTTIEPGGETRSALKPSAARDRILATAGRLFYTTGIRAVGVDRVIAESQVARMTFFRHFPSKDDLVVAFLTGQVQRARAELAAVREAAGPDWPRAVLGWVLAGVSTEPALEGFRGCEFINTAAEFCERTHPVRTVVAEHRGWVREVMREALVALDHPSPASTAELLLVLRTGAIVAASLEGFGDAESALTRTWWALVD